MSASEPVRAVSEEEVEAAARAIARIRHDTRWPDCADSDVCVEHDWPNYEAQAAAALEAASLASSARIAELEGALTKCVTALEGCDYATQRVRPGVSGAIHAAVDALTTTTPSREGGDERQP